MYDKIIIVNILKKKKKKKSFQTFWGKKTSRHFGSRHSGHGPYKHNMTAKVFAVL